MCGLDGGSYDNQALLASSTLALFSALLPDSLVFPSCVLLTITVNCLS